MKTDAATKRSRSRGQVLVMFAGGMIFFIGLMAIVIDVSWYWANTLRVQRAADAAALAGAVYLPGNVPNGKTYALAEAKKNGYTDGQAVAGGTISVVPTQDANDVRQLDVTVSAPVSTFFMRVFGINSITASRTAKAIYVQPVPMGSPENYYGIYCLTTTTDSNCDATTKVPDASGSGQLASKGFWGAFQSSGDVHNEGDAFTPYNDPLNPGSNSAGGTNPDFSAKGYDYAVEVPSDGGNIYIFDPDFCVVGGG
ncbi:MAG TPA: pilus assembly protein TadG-related protein, partial [Candidatus Binatia bacterium]|nr:pilus assembly protein TadG-related protein [Candidatus Binatia bacterium]